MELHDIRSKVVLGFKLTPKERAFFLLYGNWAEVQAFLKREKQNG